MSRTSTKPLRTCSEPRSATLARGAKKRQQAIDRLIPKAGDVFCRGTERPLDLTDAQARVWKGGAV